jgi:hypothetical protein
MGQGPHVLEKAAARLSIVFSRFRETVFRADMGTLVQETDLLDGGNTIVVTI